jgi:integrase
MKPISERIIAALPVPAKGNKRYYFSGSVLSGRVAPTGFNICVTAADTRSICLYKLGRQHTIGRWERSKGGGDTTLLAGIIRAKEKAALLAAGADPRPERTKRLEDAATPQAETVAQIVDRYIARVKKDRKDYRSFRQNEASFNRFVKPILGDILAVDLRRKNVADLLDHIADTATPLMADLAFSHFQACWRWASDRDERLPWPFVRGMRRISQADYMRTRVLSDAELTAIWAATADGSPFARYTRFLLLTGARRSEAMLFWNELDIAKGAWSLPASRNKVKFDLARPLSKLALSQLVMNGHERAFHFSNSEVTRRHQLLLEKSGTANWRTHDLRRTCRTLLSRAGVSTEVAERALGHRPPAIERTYNQYGFDEELRIAYERLAALVETIVNPVENVVPMRGR